jgi:hypothetical protein
VALARVEAAFFFRSMEDLPYEEGRGVLVHRPNGPPFYQTLEGYDGIVLDYCERCESLKQALLQSSFASDELTGGVIMLYPHKLNWDMSHGHRTGTSEPSS